MKCSFYSGFLAIYLALSSVVFAGKFEVELESGNSISVNAYPSNGDTLLIYLPAGRGFGRGYRITAKQLAENGYDVWALDLHASYMIPKYKSSVNRFNIDDLVNLVAIAEQKSFKKILFVTMGRGAQVALKIAYQWQLKNPDSNLLKGHIFHSPHLIDGRPGLGSQAKYIDIAKYSNLPIYILLPQFGTKFLRAQEIATQLKQGGSAVFTHRLTGVGYGFHMKKPSKLSKFGIKAKKQLASTYHQAIQLMKTLKPAKIVTTDKDLNAVIKTTFSDPILHKYNGKQQMPLRLKTLDGKVADINDYKGQVVLINFWASWCRPCVTEIPSLVRLQQKFNQKDFKIITINVAEPKNKIDKFIKKVGLTLPILLDDNGQAVKDWGVYAYPSNFLIDKNGTIRYGYRGALEWDEQGVVDIIQSLL
ncbi:MAG: Thiol-disulfide oxidoreductase ResA [Catillopecten margaritatus gill symbiont]|uniref:Thiol-disulfide oxidoreductase ResA n=1 Tax=Catillopecten margaritatus gill symbiont TaxID=3083288 RepID=A0AAU6PGV4_9GAMM